MSDPYDEGYDASLNGRAEDECPYSDTDDRFDEWQDGYQDAALREGER